MSPEKTPIRPIAIYVRVSRTGDRDVEAEGGTAEQQEKRCRAQLEASGYPVGETFVDLDESGGKESRPAFDEIMEGIEAGRFGGLIVINLSRFGRHRGVPKLIEQLEKEHGATLLSVEEKLDTSTPMGRFAVDILAAVNALYLDQMTVGWKRSRTTAVSLGRYAAPTPFGYARNGDKRLVPHPVNGPLVTEAFRLKADGATLVDIARFFNDAGAAKKQRYVRKLTPNTPDGLKIGDPLPVTPWADREIADLLKREVYLGVSATNDGGRNEDAHEALIDRETWLRAQAARKTGEVARVKGEHWLIGKAFCSSCGHRLARKVNRRGTPQEQVQWRCMNSACSARASISGPTLEPYVIDALVDAASIVLDDPSADDGRLDAARAKLAAAELELGTFLQVARATDPGYVEAVEQRRDAVEQAQADLALIPAQTTDWRADVRKWATDWNAFLGRDVLDPEQAVAEGEAYVGTVSGKALRALLNEGEDAARLVVRNVLRRVTVSGSKGGADGRVEVDLL